MYWLLVMLLVVGAGYYLFRRLLTIEREIRTGQQVLAEDSGPPQVSNGPEVDVLKSPDSPGLTAEDALAQRIVACVEGNPGLIQIELYKLLAETERRELQKKLRELDRQGRLRREKKGNSFRLFPL